MSNSNFTVKWEYRPGTLVGLLYFTFVETAYRYVLGLYKFEEIHYEL